MKDVVRPRRRATDLSRATSARYKTLTLAPPGQPPGQRSAHWSRSRGPSRRSRQVGGGHQTSRCLRALLNTPSKSWRNSGAAAAAARPRRRGRGPDRLRYLIAPKMQEPGRSVPARAPTSGNGGKSMPSGRTAWQWRIARSRDRYWCTCAQSSPSVLAFYVPREDGASLPMLPNDRRVSSSFDAARSPRDKALVPVQELEPPLPHR